MSVAFTPLETLLVGLAFSVLTGLVVKIWFNANHVSREECAKHVEELNNYKLDFNLIYAMLCEIVLHLPDLTPEQRAKILNMKKE